MKNKLKRLMSVMLAVMIMCSLFSINASAATTYKVTAKSSSSYYVIKNLSSKKCLNIAGLTSKKKTSGTNVNVFAYEKGSGDQLWKFTSTSKGFVLTPKANTKLCLNPHSNTPKSGTNVNVYTKISGDKTQAWKIEYVSKYKAYIFRSAYNNKLVLTAAGNGDEANVKLATYKSGDKKQLWTCSGLKATELTSATTTSSATPKTFEQKYATKLAALRKQFPNGTYWNTGNPETVSKSAHAHYKTQQYGCTCTASSQSKTGKTAWQCYGFAVQFYTDLYGVKWNGSQTTTVASPTYSKIKAGDYVRYYYYVKDKAGNTIKCEHSVFVLEKTSSYIRVVDCNSAGECQIHWDRKFYAKNISGITEIRRPK